MQWNVKCTYLSVHILKLCTTLQCVDSTMKYWNYAVKNGCCQEYRKIYNADVFMDVGNFICYII